MSKTLLCTLSAALAMSLALAGCGGSASSSSITSAPREFLYASIPNQIQIYPVGGNGILGSPTTVNGPAVGSNVVATPSARFLYVADLHNGQIDAYSINSANGMLTPVMGSPFLVGAVDHPLSLAVDPAGKFLYVSDMNNWVVAAFAIDSGSGAITKVAGSPFPSGFNPTAAVVNPSGNFLYAPDIGIGFGGISAYSINSATGALIPGSGGPLAYVISNGVNGLVESPSGNFLYVAEITGVGAFSVNQSSGALTQIGGSPLVPANWALQVATNPAGTFLFAADGGDGTISAFGIDQTTGALTAVAGSPFPANPAQLEGGILFFTLAIDPSGQFLYASGLGSILEFSINSSTGALTPIGTASSLFAGDGMTVVKIR